MGLFDVFKKKKNGNGKPTERQTDMPIKTTYSEPSAGEQWRREGEKARFMEKRKREAKIQFKEALPEKRKEGFEYLEQGQPSRKEIQESDWYSKYERKLSPKEIWKRRKAKAELELFYAQDLPKLQEQIKTLQIKQKYPFWSKFYRSPSATKQFVKRGLLPAGKVTVAKQVQVWNPKTGTYEWTWKESKPKYATMVSTGKVLDPLGRTMRGKGRGRKRQYWYPSKAEQARMYAKPKMYAGMPVKRKRRKRRIVTGNIYLDYQPYGKRQNEWAPKINPDFFKGW